MNGLLLTTKNKRRSFESVATTAYRVYCVGLFGLLGLSPLQVAEAYDTVGSLVETFCESTRGHNGESVTVKSKIEEKLCYSQN